MGRVYIVVKGGLGNQLFQAALGVALASRFGAEVRYFTDYFDRDDFRRPFLLNRFSNLPLAMAEPGEAADAPAFAERGLEPDDVARLIAEFPVLALDGHWQHERFFFGRDDAVRAALSLEVGDGLAGLGQRLRDEATIGVHVRRSEYGQMGLAKVAYYTAAIEAVRAERGADLPAVCFTDEPNFCAAVFHGLAGMTVTNGDVADPINDFYLLSRCAHFVIANSSLSWWAAWLGAGEGSIVHAPAPWCLIDPVDPIRPGWRRVEGAVQAQ
jgi:hypothetical protein